MEEIWPEPTVTELRAAIKLAEKHIQRIQSKCEHKNKKHDEQRDWEGDCGWVCMDCETIGYR